MGVKERELEVAGRVDLAQDTAKFVTLFTTASHCTLFCDRPKNHLSGSSLQVPATLLTKPAI